MKREKLYNPPEVEIPKEDGESLETPGTVVKYKATLRIKSQKGKYCRGCCFNTVDVVGGCPYYMDGGNKIFPCQKYDLIYKRVYYY